LFTGRLRCLRLNYFATNIHHVIQLQYRAV
jgi:hypothetical protein